MIQCILLDLIEDQNGSMIIPLGHFHSKFSYYLKNDLMIDNTIHLVLLIHRTKNQTILSVKRLMTF